MSIFKKILTEKRKNFGSKGGQGFSGTDYDTEKLRVSTQNSSPSQKRNLKKAQGFKLDSPNKGDRVGQQATHPVDASDARKSGADKRGGPAPNERQIGAQKPRSRFVKGQGYTIPTQGKPATRIPGASGGKPTGSLGAGTLSFPGDRSGAYDAAKVKVKDTPASSTVKQADVSNRQKEFRTKHQKAQIKSQTKTTLKGLLPSSGQTSTKSAKVLTNPKTIANVGSNLEFGKTKTGSFTYSGASASNPAVPKVNTAPKVQVAPFKGLPAGNTTIKVGNSLEKSKRVNSMISRSRQVPAQLGRTSPQKVADLGVGTNIRSGQSATIRGNASNIKPPEVKPKFNSKEVLKRAKRINAIRQNTVRSPLGRFRQVSRFARGGALLGAGIGTGLEWWDKSQANKAAGGSGALSTKDKARAILRGVAGATGYAAGATLAAPIAAVPLPGARPAAIAAGMYTGGKVSGYAVKQADKAFDASYDTIAGATKWQKKQMEKINRQNQGAGASTQQASFKKNNKAIIRDAGGKERIGYAAKLTGKDGVTKTVYKHGNDTRAQRYTSSNPLERIGRALMPDRYAANDEALRKKKVANFKKTALATEQYFTFLHITESIIAQGYDIEFIEEFWGWEDDKQIEFVNSLDLVEDIFIPDEQFLTEGNDLSENWKWIQQFFNRLTKAKAVQRAKRINAIRQNKVPTPTQTASGTPITSSTTKVTPTNTKVTGSGSAPVTSNTTKVTPANTKVTPKTPLKNRVISTLKKPAVRNAGLAAAGAGLLTIGGKLALDNNIIPDISGNGNGNGNDEGNGNGNDNNDPNSKPPVNPAPENNPSTGSSRVKRLRVGHWRAINDPPQFHRDPALAAYRNIRATKRNY